MLAPRQRRRLGRAHEDGYLDATCRENTAVIKAHGLWCWRLKVPMIWYERRSPRSRFGRLHVDLMTTPHMLTGAGQEQLKILGASAISAHSATWDRVPLPWLDRLAHAVFRIVLQPGNYRRNRTPITSIETRRRKAFTLVSRRIAAG